MCAGRLSWFQRGMVMKELLLGMKAVISCGVAMMISGVRGSYGEVGQCVDFVLMSRSGGISRRVTCAKVMLGVQGEGQWFTRCKTRPLGQVG
jgi:hypothetical protein